MNSRGTAYDTKPQFKRVANNGANYTVERCGANCPENPPSIRNNEITDQWHDQYFLRSSGPAAAPAITSREVKLRLTDLPEE
jgi:hypothetical protein